MLWRLLRTYLARFHSQLGLVVLLQLGSTIASLYLPSINGHIIDKGVATGDTTYVLVRGGMMLAITAGQIACSFCAVYIGARVAMAYGRDLRGGIFHHVGKLSARQVGRFGAPSLITRTTNDVQQVQMLVLMSMTMLVVAPIMCVGGIVMALRENLGLSKLLLVCIPAMAGSIGLIIGQMIPKFRIMQPKIDTVNRVLREQITGMRVVRAFVREPAEAARFAGANGDLTATAFQVGKLQALMWPTMTLVFNASSVALLWFGSRRIADGSLEIGALTAYLGYLMQILVGVMMASFMSIMIPRAAVCAERIVEVLDTTPELAPPAAPVVPAELTGMVELRGVEFRYPGATAPVLADISFVARPGEVTAIIGSTGAGKTTMLELVPRLSDATAGTVLVDGVDVRQREPEELWSRIGMVPQRSYLFTGTVASNLRFGNPDATDDELWAALELAQGADFVRAMPQQLEAPIAQGGTNVSGGQRQRLAIARALLREPGVFLFDDSFSALDLATEARLRAAIAPRLAKAAVILVAQRVASIRHAHQILVLDAGKLVGKGTHELLVATCPPYAEIVESQTELPAAPRGEVRFDDVSFRYKADVPLVEHLSMVAQPGQTIAIVGPTGAGKTTLVNLLMRFYDLESGAIRIDGIDIALVPRRDVRGQLGMVLQDTWLFGGTIRDNIMYGHPTATEDDMLAAAKATYVDRFVRALPGGYDTVIDEESSNLSAGEKQLITIARAFLADPVILILDEATSSVDTRTEVLVQRAMATLRERRTSFVIAHRLSTIRDADLILVMEHGKIVEQGTHEQLLGSGGAYHTLYHAQFAAPAAA